MKRKFYTLFLLFFAAKFSFAQQLFLQETFKGGVSGDGVSYYSHDYLQVDTFVFSNSVPSGAILKKAYLFTLRGVFFINKSPMKDAPLILKLNNNPVLLDSNSIVTQEFYADPSPNAGKLWLSAIDVTNYTLNSNNKLSIPCQACLMSQDTSRNYVYDGFFLLTIYENPLMQATNVTVVLNNKTYTPTINYHFSMLNQISDANDVGLSIWANLVYKSPPLDYTSNYTLSSSSGNFNLGTLDMYKGNNIWSKHLPGSFDYKNNTLTGLQDDTPDAFIDSTDALADIKTYIPNNATTFDIITSGNINPGFVNTRLGFFLAYTTPCPVSVSKDTSITICRGQSVQLQSSPGFSSYNWYPLAGLNDSTIANPVATPQHSTNYINYVKDTAGCMHTEHAQIIVHGAPVPDSLYVTDAVCGVSDGSLLIDPNYHNYEPYTYNIGSGPVTDTSFVNLSAGTYTLTTTDNAGCSYQSAFTVQETNPVHANTIGALPSTGIAPLTVLFSNNSIGASNYSWYFPDDTLHTANAVYLFDTPGSYTVTLVVTNNSLQCADTASVVITVLAKDTSGIFVPNVFSPNGDGINDVFEVKLKNATLTTFEIYNRYGTLVYSSAELTSINNQIKTVSWDGHSTSGTACSDGTYFFVLQYSINKETKEHKGFVTLVR